MKTVVVTGGFDPLHSGHIEYFKAAAALGDWLIVGLNSDRWLARKKGQPFMPFEERKAIIENLNCVNEVIGFNDDDGTACDAIMKTLLIYQGSNIVFANGGDRNNLSTPEYLKYKDHNRVEFAFGVGGDNKRNSSSWILDNWKTQLTARPWGYWRVLDDKQTVKVKELVINPGCSLSNQRHKYRHEHWYVVKGSIEIDLEWPDGTWQIQMLSEHTSYVIRKETWHKAQNKQETPAHIIEIQWGEKCVEEDIERKM